MTERKLQPGDKLPHFILKDENRCPIDISAIQGKFLVLFFYPKDDTPGCIREACSFRDAIRELEREGAVVYGVSSDRTSSHANFKSKYELPFSLLTDTAGELRKLMGVPSDLFGLIPGRVTYIFDENKTLLKVFKSQLSPEKHVKEALQIIQERQQTQ